MLHRLFAPEKSRMDKAKMYIRRILYQYKSDVDDSFSTHRYSVEALEKELQKLGLESREYFLQCFGNGNCAVFLFNKKNNRFERVQRRFMETDIVYALRPAASVVIHSLEDGDIRVSHGKHGNKNPISTIIHNQHVIGDHWKPEYVYHYTLL